jgi:hypothetical protein
MKIPKDGSTWSGTDGKKFRVLHTMELEGNIWVHYCSEGKEPPQEFSCYVESFLQRFREEPA